MVPVISRLLSKTIYGIKISTRISICNKYFEWIWGEERLENTGLLCCYLVNSFSAVLTVSYFSPLSISQYLLPIPYSQLISFLCILLKNRSNYKELLHAPSTNFVTYFLLAQIFSNFLPLRTADLSVLLTKTVISTWPSFQHQLYLL